MGYEEIKSAAVEKYKNALDAYSAKVTGEEYQDICKNLPFDFLEAKQKTETLLLYKQLGEKGQMHFRSAEEAASFYFSLSDIKKKLPVLLDGASAIVEAQEMAKEINSLVKSSPYLLSELEVDEDSVLFNLAQECLQTLPSYPELVTKKFRQSFVEGCAQSLTPGGLVKLAQLSVIKQADLAALEKAGIINEATEALSEYFGYKTVDRTVKVRGTSYSNDNGTKRQDVLKKIIDEKGEKGMVLQKSKWTPEGSTEEKNAVGVYYDGDQAGFVGQDVVDEMYGVFEDPEFSAKFSKGLGGTDGLNYGLEIGLHVSGQEKKAEEVKQPEK